MCSRINLINIYELINLNKLLQMERWGTLWPLIFSFASWLITRHSLLPWWTFAALSRCVMPVYRFPGTWQLWLGFYSFSLFLPPVPCNFLKITTHRRNMSTLTAVVYLVWPRENIDELLSSVFFAFLSLRRNSAVTASGVVEETNRIPSSIVTYPHPPPASPWLWCVNLIVYLFFFLSLSCILLTLNRLTECFVQTNKNDDDILPAHICVHVAKTVADSKHQTTATLSRLIYWFTKRYFYPRLKHNWKTHKL